jgi:DNA-binding SARP family transcriptional activator
MWLENERRHIAGTTSAVLHQAALAQLARGDVAEAVQYASELVRLNPYDENAHVLLVRCLRAAGDLEGATRQVHACSELFRRDLGIDPTPALRSAASAYELSAEARVSGSAAALAQVEAGEAALAAGAVESASRGCSAPLRPPGTSTTPGSWRGRWSPSAARWSTPPFGVRTRKARRPSTKAPSSRSAPTGPTWR